MTYRRITIGARFKAPETSKAAKFGIVLFALTGYRARAYERARRAYFAKWHEHAAALQSELDNQHRSGFGFRAIDGRRVSR